MAYTVKQQDQLMREVKHLFTTYLEHHKLRKTPERLTILEEIYNFKGHFDAEQLFNELKKHRYNVSRATVYNTLDLLVNSELITKHQFGSNHAQYERSYGFRQHDHIICLDCGRVKEFCDPRLQQIGNTAGELFNFEIRNHALTLYGQCRDPKCDGRSREG